MKLIDGQSRIALQSAVAALEDSELELNTVLKAVARTPWLAEATRAGMRCFVGIELDPSSLRPFAIRVVQVEADGREWHVCVTEEGRRVLQASSMGMIGLKEWFSDCRIELLEEEDVRISTILKMGEAAAE